MEVFWGILAIGGIIGLTALIYHYAYGQKPPSQNEVKRESIIDIIYSLKIGMSKDEVREKFYAKDIYPERTERDRLVYKSEGYTNVTNSRSGWTVSTRTTSAKTVWCTLYFDSNERLINMDVTDSKPL